MRSPGIGSSRKRHRTGRSDGSEQDGGAARRSTPRGVPAPGTRDPHPVSLEGPGVGPPRRIVRIPSEMQRSGNGVSPGSHPTEPTSRRGKPGVLSRPTEVARDRWARAPRLRTASAPRTDAPVMSNAGAFDSVKRESVWHRAGLPRWKPCRGMTPSHAWLARRGVDAGSPRRIPPRRWSRTARGVSGMSASGPAQLVHPPRSSSPGNRTPGA